MNGLPGILLVSEIPEKAHSLQITLNESGYQIKSHITIEDDVIEEVKRSQPDVIIVKTETMNQYFMNQIYDLNQESPRPIVVFTDKSESFLINSAIKSGVSAYVVDGFVAERVRSVIELAIARFKHDQKLINELSRTRSQLEERKTIERAKGIIMKSRQLSENDAFTSLRKLAMNRNQRLIDVAKDVISVSELLI
ncbi:MAG: ANTAR domain-containing protein [Thioalkalispiraceae bacterium]|jgi:response regulator NasT